MLINPVDDLTRWWRYEKKRKLYELGEFLGVAKTSIYQWQKRGRIPIKHLKKLEAHGFKVNQRANKRRDYTNRSRVDDSVTLEMIAAELEISRERARQLVISAMASFERELNKRGIAMDDLFGPN